jgi:enoyl-CoA hydratase/carnithine racemase
LPFEQLQATGLFQSLTCAEDFETQLQQLVARALEMAPLALQATKQSLLDVAHQAFDVSVLQAREAMSQGSADFAEGRLAMQQRRAPRFKGH